MNVQTFLALSASVLLWLNAQGQTPAPATEDAATPAPAVETTGNENTVGPAAALPETPETPEPPKLQPLAPVTGPVPTPGKGFPFHHPDGHSITLNIGSDKDKDGDSDSGTSDPAKIAEVIVPIFGIVFSFGCPIIIIAIILFYRQRKNRLLHQTIQSLVEKGQPIPPALLSSNGKPPPTACSDRRRGFMLTSIGAGLVLFFLANHSDCWGVGFIPLGIGIGYLLTSKFAPRGTDLP